MTSQEQALDQAQRMGLQEEKTIASVMATVKGQQSMAGMKKPKSKPKSRPTKKPKKVAPKKTSPKRSKPSYEKSDEDKAVETTQTPTFVVKEVAEEIDQGLEYLGREVDKIAEGVHVSVEVAEIVKKEVEESLQGREITADSVDKTISEFAREAGKQTGKMRRDSWARKPDPLTIKDMEETVERLETAGGRIDTMVVGPPTQNTKTPTPGTPDSSPPPVAIAPRLQTASDSRVEEYCTTIMIMLGRMSDENLMWIARVLIQTQGLGNWNDTPRKLQRYSRDYLRANLECRDYMTRQIRLAFSYNRTWAPKALARRIVVVSFLSSLSAAADHFEFDIRERD